MVKDYKGIYFNSQKVSDLEDILINYDFFLQTQEIIIEAQRGIKLFRNMKLTKYYDYNRLESSVILNSKKYKILVIGQVEDDASIIYGSHKKLNNIDLIKQALKDYPNAMVYYRPHPDVYYRNRKAQSEIDLTSKLYEVISPEVVISSLFDQVDHVYTITSLSGFEALIHGKKVTCLGTPFYSGWGITDDKQKCCRRNVTRTLEEVFLLLVTYCILSIFILKQIKRLAILS